MSADRREPTIRIFDYIQLAFGDPDERRPYTEFDKNLNFMNTVVFVLLFCFALALTILTGMPVRKALPLLATIFVLLSIPWYFATRDRSLQASPIERFFALCWIWSRRLVCFCIAAICFLLASAPFWTGSKIKISWELLFWPLGFSTAGILIARLGLIGHGANSYSDLEGARRMHEENRKRYGGRP